MGCQSPLNVLSVGFLISSLKNPEISSFHFLLNCNGYLRLGVISMSWKSMSSPPSLAFLALIILNPPKPTPLFGLLPPMGSSLFPSFSPFPPLHHLDSLVPPKVQGFQWKIAWHRVFIQDLFERLHPNLVLSPDICLLCFANTKSNDHLFIHCPFSWLLWEKLFQLINLLGLSPTISLSLIFHWRAFPLQNIPKTTLEPLPSCFIMVHLEREERETLSRCLVNFFVQDNFLYLVATWAKTHFPLFPSLLIKFISID